VKSAPFLFSLLLAAALLPVRAQKADPDALLIQDFENRVKDYVKLHKQLDATLPALKPTVSQERIAHHERELAERIRAARRGAGQGSIFTREIAAELRRLIAIAMQGMDANLIHQSLQHAEPVKLRLQVNSPYPASVPLQSTPPTLLLNLPPLPPEVDYRIVEKDLVLHDLKANLIVDFIPNAIP
jgi:hypothetical protein